MGDMCWELCHYGALFYRRYVKCRLITESIFVWRDWLAVDLRLEQFGSVLRFELIRFFLSDSGRHCRPMPEGCIAIYEMSYLFHFVCGVPDPALPYDQHPPS